MIEIQTKPISEEWLTACAVIEAEKIEENISREHAEIKSLLGKTNDIWLGRPDVYNLNSQLSKESKKSLANLLEDNDLILLQFACSFRPAVNCEFVRATIQVTMRSEKSSDEPIAYDMFPHDVYMPVTYKRTLSVDPNIKLEFVKVFQADVSAFNYENSKEFVIYQPEITSFAKGTNSPGWDFNKNSSRTILGNKDFYLIIKKTKLSTCCLTFEIKNCLINTNLLGVIPLHHFSIKDTNKPTITKEYLLE